MNFRGAWMAAALCAPALAQSGGLAACSGAKVYSPCDIVFDLSPAETKAYSNLYAEVDLHGEFRSPRHRTLLIRAFWDGGGRFVLRFTPNEPGTWDYRITSAIERFNNQQGQFTAAVSEVPGFVRAANVHHFSTEARNDPHLWMGDSADDLLTRNGATFDAFLRTRSSQHFDHVRVKLLPQGNDEAKRAIPAPDQVNPEYFRQAEIRLLALHRAGITTDLVLAGGQNQFTKILPQHQQRTRFLEYVASRFAPLNVTWELLDDFETYDDARDLLKELAADLKGLDPYHHPMAADTQKSSGPLVDDGWMDYRPYRTGDNSVGAVEQQLYGSPAVNDFWAGPEISDAGEFRRRLWNVTMDGQYPEPSVPNEECAREMKVWFEFMAGTRHWELEPYCDLEKARAIALPEIEYVIYVEKPGQVEIQLEKHKYDVEWVNPITGESTPLKDVKEDYFAGEPPDGTHDWVLHISREGKKASMLKSYKFESRPVLLQEIESDPAKVPFDIARPSGDALALATPFAYSARVKRETKATRQMTFLWTGDVTADGQGYRILGSGPEGKSTIPANIAVRYPALLHVRLYGMNGYGKLYVVDKSCQLTK